MLVAVSTASFAQSFVDTFEANSLGWTECAFESDKGSAVIDKGVMTIKSKGENKAAGALLTAMSGVATKVGENGSSRISGAWIFRKVLNLQHENCRCNMDVPSRWLERTVRDSPVRTN